LKKQKDDTSFLAKVILFFRRVKEKLSELKPIKRITQRQRTLSAYSGKRGSEESKIAYGFGMAKVISIIVLTSLLIITVLFGSGVFSYEKMYYMFKDISYIKSFNEDAPVSLNYSKPVQNQVFGNFKNGLLVASDSELKFFTSTGRVTLTEGSEFVNPHICTSNGYALIYDQGRKSFSVYNSFVKLYSERTNYPVALADMAENGSFLIVTTSSKYTSVVKIYDSNFKPIGEYSKNERVISASLSDNGRYAAVLSLYVANGVSRITLNILDCNKSEVVSNTVIYGRMPYTCSFLSNDRIAVFLDDRVSVLDKRCNTISEYIYPSSAEKIDIGDGKFAILFSKNSVDDKKKIEVFDENGAKTFSKQVSGSISDIGVSDGYVYLLKTGEVVRISTSLGTESSKSIYIDNSRLVTFKDGQILVCSQTSGSYISFD